MRSKTLTLAAFILFAALPLFGVGAEDILGLWNTPEGRSKIEIFQCGDKLCGRIAELKQPHYPPDDPKGMAGKPKVDRNNPDPQLRTRPLVGLQLMEGFRYSGANVWDGGKIYDPESGKLYRCKIKLAAPNQMEVRGFIGISLIGRTSTWTR